MKPLILSVLLSSCFVLCGCASAGQRLTPEQITGLVKAFSDAGCGGRIDVDAGAGAGQMGGEAHATLGLHGECPKKDPAS
jgi:hypothetical protein